MSKKYQYLTFDYKENNRYLYYTIPKFTKFKISFDKCFFDNIESFFYRLGKKK